MRVKVSRSGANTPRDNSEELKATVSSLLAELQNLKSAKDSVDSENEHLRKLVSRLKTLSDDKDKNIAYLNDKVANLEMQLESMSKQLNVTRKPDGKHTGAARKFVPVYVIRL